MILEGIVTTISAVGDINIAPMGPHVDFDPATGKLTHVTLRPFRTSQTFANLTAHREGVLHVTDDVLLLARSAVGALDPLPPLRPAEHVRGWVLASACRFYEFHLRDRRDAGPTNMDRRDAGATNTDRRDAGATNTDRRDAGPTNTDRRDAGPTNTDRRDAGPTNMDRRDAGPTNTDRRDAGPTNTDRRDAGPTNTDRPRFEVEIVHTGRLRDFFGFNRAKHAVVEAAILATRTAFLPLDDIEAEYRKLAVLVEKTGGEQEHAAFDFLRRHLQQVKEQRRPAT